MLRFPINRPAFIHSFRSLPIRSSNPGSARCVTFKQHKHVLDRSFSISQHSNRQALQQPITGPATDAPSPLSRDNDLYLSKKVPDLFSLQDRVVVITGAARGIGLALAFAVAEVGGKVAIIDTASQPHEHYQKLKDTASRVEYYRFGNLLSFVYSKCNEEI